MKYRKITGLESRVSRIGVGGNIFGHFCDEQGTIRILDAARAQGINLVDTADVYSAGLSEKFIGAAIKKCRNEWVIATKAGLISHGDPSGLGGVSNLRKKLEASLQRLNIDCIDIYQVHHYDPETPLAETIGALNLLKDEGKIRVFGVSNYSPKALREAAQIAVNQHAQLATIQCHYNLFCQAAASDLFSICEDFDIGVLAYGVLARGVLTGKYKKNELPRAGSRGDVSSSVRADLSNDALDAVGKIGLLAQNLGVRPEALAVAWALKDGMITSALIGMRNEEQLSKIAVAADLIIGQDVVRLLEDIVKKTVEKQQGGFGTPLIFG